MSLINDALRRANADNSRSPAPVPPMQPVEPKRSPSSILPWAVVLSGVGILGIAGILWFRGTPQPKQVAENSSSATQPTPMPAAPASSSAPITAAPVPQLSPVASPSAPTLEPQFSAPVATLVPAPAPEPQVRVSDPAPVTSPKTIVAPAEAAKPAARLQAIYYRFKNPSVVINGKTLTPGQSIDGVKVVSIQRTSVEVLQDGKYRTLTMD